MNVKFIGIAACLAALTSCAASPPAPLVQTQLRYVRWDWPPALQSCEGSPEMLAVPHIEATDPHAGSKVATYVEQLRDHDVMTQAAANDCRNTLQSAVQAWKAGNN